MSEGALFKPEKDFSKDADKLIPEAQAVAKVRDTDLSQSCSADNVHRQTNVQDAIDKLLGLEKQARQVRRPLLLMNC